jgi:hypothetical protein
LKTLYKGKGALTEPSNYRGIALLSTMLKTLTAMINKRVMKHLDPLLPPEQFGFRPGKNAHQALSLLLESIKAAKSKVKGKLYAVFVDFEKAFDRVSRDKVIIKLSRMGVKGKTLRLIGNLLQHSVIEVSDGLRKAPPIIQHCGVPQGDPLSPTLFLAFVKDLADTLRRHVKFLFFADDLVLFSEDKSDVQLALNALYQWCEENNMKINTAKTKAVKFRNGGRISRDDILVYGEEKLEFVNHYTYLGVTLQTTLSFGRHCREKCIKAYSAIATLTNLQDVSIKTATKIYDMKIHPIISYSLKAITRHLKLTQLRDLDKPKARFYKKALGLPQSASSTLALELAGVPTYCHQLRLLGHEFDDEVWRQYLLERQAKHQKFLEKGYSDGPAFKNDKWKLARAENRHLITRTTSHGFHHYFCSSGTCFDPSDECICRECGDPADRLHILTCSTKKNASLAAFVHRLEGKKSDAGGTGLRK